MANADDLRDASPWQPMTSPIDLKHLGKLAEECNELGSAIARCIIQGIDECEPVTGKLNREWLEDEVADVRANIDLNVYHFKLNHDRMEDRYKRKIDHLRQWHSMLGREDILQQVQAELLGISAMDMLTRPGEAPADQLMRDAADRALKLLNTFIGDHNQY